MKKNVINNDVFYTLAWSPVHQYDKYTARRIIPELSGIVSLQYMRGTRPQYLVFYGCWRDGCRLGLRKLLDPITSILPDMLNQIDLRNLYYKYTTVEGSVHDMQDILYWLIKTYQPEYNSADGFPDSKRFKNISIKEMEMGKDDVVERMPRIG